MKTSLGLGAVGVVRIEKWSKARGKEVLEFPNQILRVGFETYLDRSIDLLDASAGNSCFLGTGTTAPTLDDSGLEQVDVSTSRYRSFASRLAGNQNTDRYYSSAVQFRYDWGEGEAEGTWTELGLAFWDLVGSTALARGNNNTYSFPFSRALIRDENADPISLTVLPDEYLRIFYTVIGYVDRSTVGSSVSFDGVPAQLEPELNVSNRWHSTFSSWSRFFHTRLPTNSARLLAVTGQGTNVDSQARVADKENRTVVFTLSQPPGIASNYNGVSVGAGGNQTDITWNFSAVSKPLEKNISGTVTLGIQAKHWKVLLIGKVGSATATTLTMTGANWTPDQFAGMVAGIVAGTGRMSMSTIVSNTADTLTISPGWHTMPIEGSLFEIREYDYE